MPKRDYQKCAVSGCDSRVANENVKFFMFPVNEFFCEQWLRIINNPKLANCTTRFIRRNYSVCEKHFVESDFQTPERKKLNRGVLPKIVVEATTSAADEFVSQPSTSAVLDVTICSRGIQESVAATEIPSTGSERPSTVASAADEFVPQPSTSAAPDVTEYFCNIQESVEPTEIPSIASERPVSLTSSDEGTSIERQHPPITSLAACEEYNVPSTFAKGKVNFLYIRFARVFYMNLHFMSNIV